MTVETPERAGINVPDREGLYASMFRMRRFEERAYELFLQNHIHGTMHLGLGQEAVAAGVAAALRPDDYSLGTYRGHNHIIARGAPLDRVMAELFGRATGLCKGKGGSMHLTSVDHGAYGSYAIVGAHLPIACGIAWSSKVRGTDQVTVCFFGDGATNIGAFHEALNLAVVWRLPVVFVCENNLYMEFTPIGSVTAVVHPAGDRAPAYSLPSVVVDGNDVEAVYGATAPAVAAARAGEGPALLEMLTYRYSGHSRTDPGAYRPAGELDQWKERDPIAAFRRRLTETRADMDRLERMEADVEREVAEAVESSLNAPQPDPDDLLTDVFASNETRWRT